MKRLTLAIAMAALVLFAGCKKDKETTGTTIKASIEQCKGDGSKTTIVPDGAEAEIRWTAGDKILVNNGTMSGIFTLVGAGGSTSGDFSYNGEYTFGSTNVAVYPAENTTISGNTVTVNMPDVVEFDANKNGANPMLGIITNPAGFTMKSLCGALGISLTGDNVAITAVEIESKKADDKLNDKFEVADYTAAEPRLVAASDNAGTNKAKITFESPITLTSTAQNFYFALPVGTLSEGFTLKVYGDGDDPIFSKPTVNTTENYFTIQYNTLNAMPAVAVTTGPVAWDGDLSKLTSESTAEFATATNGMTITGTLAANVKVSIADGATVTLDNVTINGEMDIAYRWAGISCLGDATIILKDGTTNTVKGFFHIYPGIHIATGHTLTIQGTGSLDASSNGNGAGIGGGASSLSCGNISIESGIITATGGGDCAGIGGGAGNGMTAASCGYITISGGAVTAVNNGGSFGAGPGIGSGRRGSCGNITITDGASVTATKGNYALDCIGRGQDGTCGKVTIGGVVFYDATNGGYQNGYQALLQNSSFSVPPFSFTLTFGYEGSGDTESHVFLYGETWEHLCHTSDAWRESIIMGDTWHVAKGETTYVIQISDNGSDWETLEFNDENGHVIDPSKQYRWFNDAGNDEPEPGGGPDV